MPSPTRQDPKRRRAPEPRRRQLVVTALGLVLAIGFYQILMRLESGPLEFFLPSMGPGSALLEDDSFIAQRSLIEPLSGLEQRRLREQRTLIDELARRHIGTPLTAGESMDDLRVIQELLDKRVLKRDQIYELQALGVALGDLLARQLDLEWVSVEDELGRSRALQFGEGEDLIFPVTMISKRVEADVRFRVKDLYEKSESAVEGFRLRASGGRRLKL